eukprot:1147506-Pelagomonas_calceolata.AAC.1
MMLQLFLAILLSGLDEVRRMRSHVSSACVCVIIGAFMMLQLFLATLPSGLDEVRRMGHRIMELE